MHVDPSKAAASVEFDRRPYYFCSKGCAAKFQQNPAKFLAANATTAQHTAATQHMHHQIASAPLTQIAAPMQSASAAAPAKTAEGVRYTCPMHPQIVQIGPGSCPICGMALEPMDPLAAVEADPEYDSMRKRFWISAGLSLPLLVLAMLGDYLGLHIAPTVRNGIEFVLATPVVLWGGWPFFQRFWASLVHRSLNMFTLIALGIGAAYLHRMSATAFPQMLPGSIRRMDAAAPVNCVAAEVIPVLVLLGQVLELRAREE